MSGNPWSLGVTEGLGSPFAVPYPGFFRSVLGVDEVTGWVGRRFFADPQAQEEYDLGLRSGQGLTALLLKGVVT